MKRQLSLVGLIAVVGLLPIAAAQPLWAVSISYKNFDVWGGGWYDAEKSPTNTEDDLMCWAAASSNVLAWTGWGQVGGMTNADQMFAYYQNHWTDEGGTMAFAWNWWFDGVNPAQGPPWDTNGWSQVDVPGGNFWPTDDIDDFFHFNQDSGEPHDPMVAIDRYLRAGYGVALGVFTTSGGAHAITCWGYAYDDANPSQYYGVWVTDSDDSKGSTSPPDLLRYYDVSFHGGEWYLQNFYGSNAWYIDEVQALDRLVPEPITLAGVLMGLGGLVRYLRNRRAGHTPRD
jgi:hypothetical protein